MNIGEIISAAVMCISTLLFLAPIIIIGFKICKDLWND